MLRFGHVRTDRTGELIIQEIAVTQQRIGQVSTILKWARATAETLSL